MFDYCVYLRVVRQCKKPTLGQAHLVFADTQEPTLKNQKSLPFSTAE